MKFDLDFPDSIYNIEPETWNRFAEALQGMLNRMAMSYHKYHSSRPLYDSCPEETKMVFTRQRMAMYDGGGPGENLCDCGVGIGVPIRRHRLNCFLSRVKLSTGNVENCLDAANGLVLEMLFPTHPKAHFRSQSSEESPGITYKED